MIKVSVMYPNLDARMAPPVAGVVFTNLSSNVCDSALGGLQ
jgi:hypothetical protein